MSKCAICQRERTVTTLQIEEDGEYFTTQVCSGCWDAVATIARRAVESDLSALDKVAGQKYAELHQRIERLEAIAAMGEGAL